MNMALENQPLGLGRLSLPLRVNARAGPTQMSGAVEESICLLVRTTRIDTVGLDAKRTLTRSGSERRTRPLGRKRP